MGPSDGRSGQLILIEYLKEARPSQASLAPPTERAIPSARHRAAEARHRQVVARQPVVRVVAAKYAEQPAMLNCGRLVHLPSQFAPDGLELAAHAPALGLALHYEAAVPGRRAVMREAQEGEDLAASFV